MTKGKAVETYGQLSKILLISYSTHQFVQVNAQTGEEDQSVCIKLEMRSF